jgi:hypothetical protein
MPDVIAALDKTTIALASSERDAGDTFTVGLTLKHSSPPLIARPVRSRILWWALNKYNHRGGHPTFVDDVPSRLVLPGDGGVN